MGNDELHWDNEQAINFLSDWSLNGPWALTTIDPKSKKLVGKMFLPGQTAELSTFLDNAGENELNVYFHVNHIDASARIHGKARRDDISLVTHFHVDIDPRVNEPLDAERLRIKNLVTDLPSDIPPPTFTIDSGGGYQLFWELSQPIPIANIMEAESAKLYNLQLEVRFSADNCHNIDRIMRLPGTINVPDEKKKKKGRVKALASVVHQDLTRIYEVDRFTAAANVQVDTGFGSAEKIVISGNIQRAGDLMEIKAWAEAHKTTLPERTIDLIVQAMDTNDPTKYPGRSEALGACVVDLVNAKFTDTEIYSIITDPSWAISASVIDKGSSMDRYAKRQIERAREFVKSPTLLRMNEQHAVIAAYGGKCVVIQEILDPHLNRTNLIKQSFTDFRNRYMHEKVSLGIHDGQEKFAQLGKWWLEHESRRQYTNIVFAPNKTVEDAYNLWQGYGVEAIPGHCDVYLNHVFKIICGGNDEYYQYLLNWMARAVQYPDRAGETAVVLRGRQGTGKSLFVKHFGALFGRHFLQISDAKHLVGHFNQHLRDCIILFGDEAFFAGDKKHEGNLKLLVTEDYLTIEGKGVDVETAPNYLHLLMASNNDWVVPAGLEERRFFVLDVLPSVMQNTQYFKKLNDEMMSGGREALLHFLMNRNISEFNHRKVPNTDALFEQKQLSMTPEMEWWYNKLCMGSLLNQFGEWFERVPMEVLFKDYVEYLHDLGHYRRQTKTSLGRFLQKVNPMRYPHRMKERMPNDDGQDIFQGVWGFPSLKVCREYWESKYFQGEWIEASTEPPISEAF